MRICRRRKQFHAREVDAHDKVPDFLLPRAATLVAAKVKPGYLLMCYMTRRSRF
jgi:hypothetical protein